MRGLTWVEDIIKLHGIHVSAENRKRAGMAGINNCMTDVVATFNFRGTMLLAALKRILCCPSCAYK